MTNIRTSTLVLHQQNKDGIRVAQNNITKVSDQVTSGIESRDFHGISHKTNVESHLINKNAQSTLNHRLRNNELLTKKFNTIEANVMGLHDVVKDGLVLSIRARSPASGDTLNTVDLAKQQLAKIHNLMQGEFNGQYLFSGSDVRTMPVNDFINNTNIVSGAATANYYQGNNDKMISKISDSTEIEYGLKANDPAIANIIGAFHKMIDAKISGDATKYVEAVDLLNIAKTELGNYTAKLGNNYEIVENQLKFDKILSLKLNETISDVEEVDIPIAMAEMINAQTQLQAAFTLLVRANSITLADYLH